MIPELLLFPANIYFGFSVLLSWLLQRDVHTAGENAVRLLHKEMTQSHLQAYYLPLQTWQDTTCIVKMAPFVSVSSLEEKVMSLLEEYNE